MAIRLDDSASALLSRQRWLNVVATAFNGIVIPPIAGFGHSDETDIYVIPG